MSKEKNELPLSNNIKHQVKNRVNLVHRDLEILQWPNFFSIEPTSNYSNRCFPSLQWGSSFRAVAKEERTLHINVLELLAIRLALFSFIKGEKVKAMHFQIDNKASLSYLLKMRGTKKRTYDQIEQRHLALRSKSQYGYHCRIPAFSTEYSSRQRIKKKNQTLQSGFFISTFFKRFLDY